MEPEDSVFDKDRLMQANRFFKLDSGMLRDLLGLCDALAANAAMQRQASAVHECFFHSDAAIQDAVAGWNKEVLFPDEIKPGVAALVVISGLDHMMAVYHDRGIPDSRLAESLRDMTIWMDHYWEHSGRTGLAEVGWLLQTLRGWLFRVGRFQFMHRQFDWKFCLVARRSDRMPVAFFMQQEKLRGDGLVDGTNGIFDTETGWQSIFEITDKELKGTAVHPLGVAIRKELALPLSNWELALVPGDGVLDLHIPKDGRMEIGECRDSILSAMAFFDEYFPDKPHKAIQLCSWLLDPQLQKILPGESNIVRFQREFYLVPLLADHKQTYERVFGDSEVDIACAPGSTSLQRAVKGYVLAGNHMRQGAGVILAEDMKQFGAARYQYGASAAFADVAQSQF